MDKNTNAGYRAKYDAIDAEHRAKRYALDIEYDKAIDRHGADPVLFVAFMDGFDALDADFLAKRDALDAEHKGGGPAA